MSYKPAFKDGQSYNVLAVQILVLSTFIDSNMQRVQKAIKQYVNNRMYVDDRSQLISECMFSTVYWPTSTVDNIVHACYLQ